MDCVKDYDKSHIWYVYDLVKELARKGEERFLLETVKENMDKFFQTDIPIQEVIDIVFYHVKEHGFAKVKFLYFKSGKEVVYNTVHDFLNSAGAKLEECYPVFYITKK